MTQLEVAVFSYNRGAWLENCLRSIRTLMPDETKITVYDDNSDDPKTTAILADLPDDIALVQPPRNDDGRHGGLYRNMGLAQQNTNADMLLCLQDDTQIVRPVGRDEILSLHQKFDAPHAPGFVAPLFLLARKRRKITQRTQIVDEATRSYTQTNSSLTSPQYLAYRDVCLWNMRAIRATDWHPAESEQASAKQARSLFGAMHLMADPFVAFVPQVPTFRGRKQTLGARLAEQKLGTSPKPYRPMSPEQADSFRKRPLSQIPFGDDFLATIDPDVQHPFEPNAIDAIPLYRFLDKLELKLFGRG